MRERKKTKSGAYFLLVLYAMLIISLLILMMVGGQLFSHFTDNRNKNEDLRATLSYVQGKVSALDEAGGITITKGPGGDMLVLREGDSGYETRIFLNDGRLMELLAAVGSETVIEDAQVINDEDEFSLEVQDEGRLLLIRSSGGEAYSAIRSGGGVADER